MYVKMTLNLSWLTRCVAEKNTNWQVLYFKTHWRQNGKGAFHPRFQGLPLLCCCYSLSYTVVHCRKIYGELWCFPPSPAQYLSVNAFLVTDSTGYLCGHYLKWHCSPFKMTICIFSSFFERRSNSISWFYNILANLDSTWRVFNLTAEGQPVTAVFAKLVAKCVWRLVQQM